ncbi:MAG: hypothetical protein VXW43_19890, partial [Pseudomonadota bacterium]|nr:hypothetical protein [Pseudomonadota bacterium]
MHRLLLPLALLRLPFDSEEAARVNRDVFEAIYVGALEASGRRRGRRPARPRRRADAAGPVAPTGVPS